MSGLSLLNLGAVVSFFSAFVERGCGRSFNTTNFNETKFDRIVGGTTSKPGAWPWMAALAAPSKIAKNEPEFRCGGALISDRLVLTAAHCYDEELYLVRLGVNSLDSRTEKPTDILIKKNIIHEGFHFPEIANDIAIILLNRRVNFTDRIQPICLPTAEVFLRSHYENKLPFVAGWGDVNPGEGQGSLTLQEVRLPVWNLQKCKKIYGRENTVITNSNICAGYEDGGRDACQGDSGGPLMLSKNDQFFVIGIVSFGKSCALPGVPGVFTRVASYLPWIKNILDKVDIARKNKADKRTNHHGFMENGPYRRFLDSTPQLKVRYMP